MDRGAQLYRELIDTLVQMSRKSVGEQWALKGEAKGTDEHITKLSKLFAKLSDDERKTLAEFAADEYMSGIYDTLCELEWYADCKDMTISIDGEQLPLQKYEGMGNDFIGRRSGDWDWSE